MKSLIKTKSKYPILLYHGVTTSLNSGILNHSKKHLSLQEFEEQISFVRKYLNPISFRHMADSLKKGAELPSGSIAITFDDSYRNVYTNAIPVLRKYNIPATFFISTGFIGKKRLYWTDKIEYMINISEARVVYIDHEGLKGSFDLSNPQEKIKSLLKIKKRLKDTFPDARDGIIDKMKELLNVEDPKEEVFDYEHLTWDEVASIEDLPDYEIGGHTVNHEILSYLDEGRLHYEVNECLNAIENHLKRKIDLFSYPEGRKKHFNNTVIDVLKRAGIVACPSAIDGYNVSPANPFLLKRTMVGFMGKPFPYSEYKELVS